MCHCFVNKFKILSIVFALGFSVLSFSEIKTSGTNNSSNVITTDEVNNDDRSDKNSIQKMTPSSLEDLIVFDSNITISHSAISDSYAGGSIMTRITFSDTSYRYPMNITVKHGDSYDYARSFSELATSSPYGYYYNNTNGDFGITSSLRNVLSSTRKLTIKITFMKIGDAWSDSSIRSSELTLANSSSTNSESNPYLISTANDLGLVSYLSNYTDDFDGLVYLKLVNDIDLSDHYFVPINGVANKDVYFSLDGNNKKISNLKFVFSDDLGQMAYVGLFGYCKGYYRGIVQLTKINDLTLENISYAFSASSYNYEFLYIGSLCGYAEGQYFTHITINNFNFECPTSTTIVTYTSTYFGGFIGRYYSATPLDNIKVTLGTISLNIDDREESIGGFIGYLDVHKNVDFDCNYVGYFRNLYVFYTKQVTINSYFENTDGSINVGGFVGVLNCYNNYTNTFGINNILVSTADGFSLESVITLKATAKTQYVDATEINLSGFIGYFYYKNNSYLTVFFDCEVRFVSTNSSFKAFNVTIDNNGGAQTTYLNYGNIFGNCLGYNLIEVFNSMFYVNYVEVINNNFYISIDIRIGDGIGYLETNSPSFGLLNNVFSYVNFSSSINSKCYINVSASATEDVLKTCVSESLFNCTFRTCDIAYKIKSNTTTIDSYTGSQNFGNLNSSNIEGKRDSLNDKISSDDKVESYPILKSTDLSKWKTDSSSILSMTPRINITEHLLNSMRSTIIKADYDTETIVNDPSAIKGKIFEGWYYDKDYTDSLTNLNTAKKQIFDSEIYAKFSNMPSVVFDTNGGSAKETIYGTAGSTIVLGDNPTKEGYTFGGWFTDQGLTNEFTSNVFTNDSITLYAKWVEIEKVPEVPVIVFPHPTFNINYVTNGGVINDTNYPTTYKTGDTVVLPSDVTKASAIFLGWYDNDRFSGSAITSLSQFALGDFTFYAKWSVEEVPVVEHKITYILNNGTINDSSYANSFIEGVGTTNIPTNITLDGFTFDGWYDNKDFTGSAIKEIGSDINSDVTLYAKFTKNEEKKENNSNNYYWFLLLLLIPVIGLIVWLIIHNKHKNKK